MNLRRLRKGEWLALAGALGFLISLFFDWFSAGGEDVVIGASDSGVITEPGVSGLGLVILIVALVPVLLALTLAATTAAPRPVAWSVASNVATAFAGILVAPVLFLRTLLFQPDFGVGLANGEVGLRLGAFFGLLLFVAIPVGGWLAMADERRNAPESAFTPPAPRPIPEPHKH